TAPGRSRAAPGVSRPLGRTSMCELATAAIHGRCRDTPGTARLRVRSAPVSGWIEASPGRGTWHMDGPRPQVRTWTSARAVLRPAAVRRPHLKQHVAVALAVSAFAFAFAFAFAVAVAPHESLITNPESRHSRIPALTN